jgi:hypothetical protein
MLIGNRRTLGFEIQPLSPSWERRYRPEQTCWGGLTIWVGGTNLCEHLEPGSDAVGGALNVPLAPIANWLIRAWPAVAFEERASHFPTTGSLHRAVEEWGTRYPPENISEDDWIDSREAWWTRHFLVAGADGAILPSLALSREDEKLMLDWRQPVPPGEAPRFVNASGSAEVAWVEGETTVTAFVAYIAEWLRHDGLADLYPWVSKQHPLQDSRAELWEAIELYTGRTRDELRVLADSSDAQEVLLRLGLGPDSDDPAASPLTQALRELPPSLPREAGSVLAKLELLTRSGKANGLVRLRAVASDATRDAPTPEAAGYATARAVRRDLGLDGAPIVNLEEVLKFVNVDVVTEAAVVGRTRMMAGFRLQGGAVAMVLPSPRTGVAWGRRFEEARGLGHLLTDPVRGGALGAASSPYSSEIRKRRSGAFAAELLLPEAALLKETHGQVDRAAEDGVFRNLMRRFGVGARTAAHHLWNLGLLSSIEMRDELIDTYAAPSLDG